MLRTTSTNSDFQELVRALDIDLKIRDGEDHAFYAQFSKIDSLQHVVVLYVNNEGVGCGAFKELQADTVEIKRMYLVPTLRGNGYASLVLHELEKWAEELGYKQCRLETGLMQPEAIAVYTKNGYYRIPNYGQYEGVDTSVCFEKNITTE